MRVAIEYHEIEKESHVSSYTYQAASCMYELPVKVSHEQLATRLKLVTGKWQPATCDYCLLAFSDTQRNSKHLSKIRRKTDE